MKKNWHFFGGLFALILYLFKNAFSIKLFQDDYLFVQITKIEDVWGFLNFFNPIRDYSYKPLPTEVFYFIFQQLGNNFFIAHSIVFITYFIGLIYLYRIIVKVTKNEIWAKVSTLLYGISFIHVFQLYWLATYQEILMFTLLSVSFYKYLNNKVVHSLLFFILALFCKETAILYAVFLVFWSVIRHPETWALPWMKDPLTRDKQNVKFYFLGFPLLKRGFFWFGKLTIRMTRQVLTMTLPFIISAGIFYLVYRYSLSSVTANPNYAMNFSNIRLFINNAIWYMLWALGLPNFLPDYMRSIFSLPIPEFWLVVNNDTSRKYFFSLAVFYLLSVISIALAFIKNKNKKELFLVLLFTIISFYIFLGPILFFMHKWMVRLTIPLVFLSVFQGYIVMRLLDLRINKVFINILLISYLVFNYFGIFVHEETSNYMDESKVFNNMEKIVSKNKDQILTNRGIFLLGDRSQRLRNTLHDQSYIEYYLPNSNIKTYYQDIYKDQPSNTFLIDMNDLFK